MLSHMRAVLLSEAGQECLLWSPLHAEGATCCPIRAEVIEQVATLPESGPQTGEQPCEAVPPVAAGVQEAEQYIHQQRGPHLPLDRLAAVAEEVAQVQCLLDLLEEGLDVPACLVLILIHDCAEKPLGWGASPTQSF
jgi:hypothetical protein